MSSSLRHLRNAAIFLFVVNSVAVVGYMIAGWTFLESVYMAIITVFGVGFGEVKPVDSDALRFFTILFIFFGCTGYIYIGSALVQFLVEGQIEQKLGKRRMSKSLESLSGHTIICGFGRVGQMLATELASAGHPFVVIESNEGRSEKIEKLGYLHIDGDATLESSLSHAGIESASTIAVVIPSDAVNVFITLSARTLNPDLEIIARGLAVSTEVKLRQAGANRVIMAEHIGAERIAGLILRPSLGHLISEDQGLGHIQDELAELGIQIEELDVSPECRLVDRPLSDLEMTGSSAFLIVKIIRKDGRQIHRPGLETKLLAGDTILMLCHRGTRPAFADLFSKVDPK
ncbi:MAG: potassium channel protein [Akkermansiaceae bacterium]|nr:potassium channel protein [Akkermansiaceae bacterium]